MSVHYMLSTLAHTQYKQNTFMKNHILWFINYFRVKSLIIIDSGYNIFEGLTYLI